MACKTFTVIAVVTFLAVSGCATMGLTAPAKYSGGVLVNAAAMTLYTFDKDPAGSGKSVCNAQCAVNRPPLRPSTDDKSGNEFSIITRDDSTKQGAYKGNPLYP